MKDEVESYETDEEINEDEAFNTDDEALYGKFFEQRPHIATDRIRTSKFLGVEVSIPRNLGQGKVTKMQVEKGARMLLSHACLDVPTAAFRRLRLMVRCLYSNDGNDNDDVIPWICICNYLGDDKAWTIAPSTMLGLEIRGPCTVEWKVEQSESLVPADGSINIFGQIVSSNVMASRSRIVSTNDGNGCNSMSWSQNQANINDEKNDGPRMTNSNKRKSDHEKVETSFVESVHDEPALDQVSNDYDSASKLTKKQRMVIALEKTKQLEETLLSSRKVTPDETSPSKSKKKKKKKQSPPEPESTSTPTSLTRQRRLPGGILVRDILVGTGTVVSSGRRISLHYTGSLQSNGRVFDKNHRKTQPLQFRQGTGEVIRGLERGLEGMKVGGERVINVPASLGYGEKGMGESIPPNSDLVFEVKLLKVG